MEKTARLYDSLKRRFGPDLPDLKNLDLPDSAVGFLGDVAARGSCRAFTDAPVPPDLMRFLGAMALSAPSKSDLQQRDVIWLDGQTRAEIKALLTGQPWIAGAPEVLVFCGNNRRQRQMHALWERPFVNDHLDAFFNASVDAGIALATCILAAESIGLGCCPISAIRNHAPEVGKILGLPDHVFPVAGLVIGWPASAARNISPRLPLKSTFHEGRYHEEAFRPALDAYDQRRAEAGLAQQQRAPESFGIAEPYLWSDDKTRQYAQSEREGFGDYIRSIGFKLD